MVDLFSELNTYEHTIVVLSLITAVAVSVQAVFSIKQGGFTKKHLLLTEELLKQKKPHVEFGIISGGPLVGFWITNHSTRDVAITSWGLELGVPKDSPTRRVHFLPSRIRDRDRRLSDFDLPYRLQHGERIEFLFHDYDVEGKIVRPFCQDSLNNTHSFPGWEDFANSRTCANPGPGLITPEEAMMRTRRPWRERMKLRIQQRRTARRKKRYER